jgi:hypothetical protein
MSLESGRVAVFSVSGGAFSSRQGVLPIHFPSHGEAGTGDQGLEEKVALWLQQPQAFSCRLCPCRNPNNLGSSSYSHSSLPESSAPPRVLTSVALLCKLPCYLACTPNPCTL